MKTKPLYLVVSRRGPSPRNVPRRSHLRLVHSSAAAERAATPPPASLRAPARSLSRPLGQRLLQAASDAAVLCLALLAGLSPNA